MGDAYFYHLTHTAPEPALQMLVQKALAQGWRIEIRGTQASGIEALDLALWLGADDSFVPHGQAGGPHDADQPVLLTTGNAPPANHANCLITVDRAAPSAQDVQAMQRTMIVFNGNDSHALSAARTCWSDLKTAGCTLQYWAQDDTGRWVKKAEQKAG